MAKKRNIEGERLHHFELSEKNRTVRWVLIAILLAVGSFALIVGLMSALQTPPGWQTIEASSTELNGSGEFLLQYDLGAGQQSASAESKTLELLYGQLSENAWQLFYNESGGGELKGLYSVNSHPNQELKIDPHLYEALLQLQENGTRALYLAPVYSAYDEVFHSADTIVAEDNDPTQNSEERDYVLTLARFANDPESVQLELRGENRVYLKVSEAYQSFIKENEIQYLLDFGWMRNAFVIDYLAQQLAENGYTNGYLSSVDGFTRNLDQRGTAYSFDLLNLGSPKAVMEYHGAISIAFLRAYPMYQEDSARYYSFADGRTISAMIDPEDGQSKAALEQMVSYSTELGCAELAMSMLPVYAAEELDEGLIDELRTKSIYSLWFDSSCLYYNQQGLKLSILDPAYTPELVQ